MGYPQVEALTATTVPLVTAKAKIEPNVPGLLPLACRHGERPRQAARLRQAARRHPRY